MYLFFFIIYIIHNNIIYNNNKKYQTKIQTKYKYIPQSIQYIDIELFLKLIFNILSQFSLDCLTTISQKNIFFPVKYYIKRFLKIQYSIFTLSRYKLIILKKRSKEFMIIVLIQDDVLVIKSYNSSKLQYFSHKKNK